MSCADIPMSATIAEVTGRRLVVLVVDVHAEVVDGRAGEAPVGGRGRVGEQHPDQRALGPDQQHEVLGHGDQRQRTVLAGVAAQLLGDGVDVVERAVGQLGQAPVTLVAVGDDGQVDLTDLGIGDLCHRTTLLDAHFPMVAEEDGENHQRALLLRCTSCACTSWTTRWSRTS